MPSRNKSRDPQRKTRTRTKVTVAEAPLPTKGGRALSKTLSRRSSMTQEELWADLRQGARNVAGVSWQTAVTAHVLVKARAGELPFVGLTPEGFEDLDCAHLDGTTSLVQMKELAAGFGRLTAGTLAEALLHGSLSGGYQRIVVVTDAAIGSGLRATGWDDHLGSLAEAETADLRKALSPYLSTGEVAHLLRRSSVVVLPWALRTSTERAVSETYSVPPIIAQFVVSELYAWVSQVAANQRDMTMNEARTLSRVELDSLVASVVGAVDLDSLDKAILAGVCSTPDFFNPSDISDDQFYLGVDGSPAIVAAGLDVARPREFGEVVDGLANQRSAMLLGPSGSGKSVLLWRSARDASPAARVLRILRLETEEDLQLLRAHMRLLRPSESSPLLVVADNLGRPGMELWPRAAAWLREVPSTLLLSACRSEDFHPNLVQGSTQIIDLLLDAPTALGIGERLNAAGVDTQMEPQEAHGRSAGLLMEFIALLTTGRRLEEVISAQAADLSARGTAESVHVARVLSAANSMGLSVGADRLQNALPNIQPAQLAEALARLSDEHIIVQDGLRWAGLHELRSNVLVEALHRVPPPTLHQTLADLVLALTCSEAGWLLRRVAERHPSAADTLARSVSRRFSELDGSAQELAELLEGAERADNALYVRSCLPKLQSAASRHGMSVHELSMFVYGLRNQGLDLKGLGPAGHAIRAIAREMPIRQDRITARLVEQLSTEGMEKLARRESSLISVTRLLEAAGSGLRLDSPALSAIARLLGNPVDAESIDVWARLVEAISQHLGPDQFNHLLGTPHERSETVASADPDAISVSFDEDESIVTMVRMLRPNPQMPATLEWDSPASSESRDIINEITVAAARRLASACPEATTIEIVTVDSNGRRFELSEHEPGHKRMARDAFPDRSGVRRNVGFQAALRRATAGGSWTSLTIAQSEISAELVELIHAGMRRLKADDGRATTEKWRLRLESTQRRCTSELSRSALTAPSLGTSHAIADAADRQSNASSAALGKLATALGLIEGGRGVATAMQIRAALADLKSARQTSNPYLDGVGSPISIDLLDSAGLLARLAIANELTPGCLAALDPANLLSSGRNIAETIADSVRKTERTWLDAIFATLETADVREFVDPNPHDWSINVVGHLVLVDAAEWAEARDLVASSLETERSALDARAIIVATDIDETGRYVLPLAFMVGFSADVPSIDLDPESVGEIAAAAGMPAKISGAHTESLTGGLRRLIDISYAAALQRARPSSWPADDPSDDVATVVEDCAEALAASGEHAGITFSSLAAHVERELQGEGETVLAALLLRNSQDGVSEVESCLIDAVNVFYFASLNS